MAALNRGKNWRRKGISVMFMTFIAICILTTIFLTMYLHLIRVSTLASEAERLYAEAAQEKLKVIYYPDVQNLTVVNEGGIGVVIKYVVELDEGSKQAIISDWTTLSPQDQPAALGAGESTWKYYQKRSPNNRLIILTERGSKFFAKPPSPEGGGASPLTGTLQYDLLSIPPGYSASDLLTVLAGESYPGGTVYLSSLYAPSGWTITYNPDELLLVPREQEQSTMTVAVPSGTAYDRYEVVTLLAGKGGVSSLVTLMVLVGDFSISFDPNPLTLSPGQSGSSKVVLTSNNYESEIGLSVRSCPSEWTCTLADQNLTLLRDQTAETIINISVPSNAATGTYSIVVEAVDQRTGYSKTSTLTVEVSAPDFRITVSPSIIFIRRGSSGSVTVTVESIGGYSGTVSLSVVRPPPRITFIFNPRSVSVSPSNPGQSILNIYVSSNARIGIYRITVRGTDQNGVQHDAYFWLIVR